jgi:hypothetical protein
MEFAIMAVVVLFVLPFPKKWRFVWRVRCIGLGVVGILVGLTVARMYGLGGEIGGAAILLASAGLLYLAFRPKMPTLPFLGKK